MEVNENNLNVLATFLNSTLNPDYSVRRPAEQYLEQVEQNEGYPCLLLALLAKDEAPLQIRVACAITLKNYIKRNWRIIEGEPVRISDLDRESVKQQIVNLMLSAPDSVQRQLAEALTLIGREDFPDRWPNLLSVLIEKLTSDSQITVINSVLRTANSLFERYRHEMRSDRLWLEIKHVLDNFAQPLTDLFVKTVDFVENQLKTAPVVSLPLGAVLKPFYECLILISKIFYSLNSQDLPEFFEDNMKIWMPRFLQLLSTNVPCLRIPDDDETDETGVVEELWSQICDIIAMYAQKYEEEFATYLEPFVGIVWQLLVTTGKQTRYDLLVSNAIQFLASVCEREQYKHLFESGDTLSQICEKVIIPNMEFRSSDEELFEDNPEEFIRKDIEGSDVDTRRRSAADFVKALCKHFESTVIQIFSAYINQLFQQYASNPKNMWARKDAAIYLVVTLVSKSQTARYGATKTSELVNLVDFFKSQIAGDLDQVDVNELPVLKADALKYVVTFRNQMPKDVLVSILPSIVRLLTADSVVVHSYAAHTLERILTLKDSSNQLMISVNELRPLAVEVFTNLFGIFDKRSSTENEYAMKCIMRCLATMSDAVVTLSTPILKKLADKIRIVSKNPNKPHFNHYLFECVCVLIKTVCKLDPANGAAQFEEVLFPPFEEILRQDVVEFMPYVFQVMSLMLDTRGAGIAVSDSYMSLLPFLMMPALWERPGNVPALVKLIQAFVRVGSDQILAANLSPILGIFQKLIASPSNDHEGFYILNTIIEYGKLELLSAHLKGVFTLLFMRMKNKKTTKFVKGLICFVCLFVVKHGSKALIEVMDSVQTDIFGMFVEKLLLPDLQKISGNVEKKICCVGITRLLVEAPELMVDGKYDKLWPKLLQGVIGLFELPEESAADEDEYFLDVEDLQGYTAAYSQLAFANHPEHDPTGVADARVNLIKSLQKLNTTHGERLSSMVQTMDEKARIYLQQYSSAAGLMLQS